MMELYSTTVGEKENTVFVKHWPTKRSHAVEVKSEAVSGVEGRRGLKYTNNASNASNGSATETETSGANGVRARVRRGRGQRQEASGLPAGKSAATLHCDDNIFTFEM